jgi:ubiquinone/menaquinone biosynthesis C-methylase UbiE
VSARRWAADNPGNQAIREEVAAAALRAAEPALRVGGDVLDAGCGTGWWLARLLEAGVAAERLHGIDRDAARVAAAGQRAPGARVVEGDVRSLPYADGSFGAVFMLTVLSSVDDAAAAAAEAWRVLAPGGLLVIWEPRAPNPVNRATQLVRPGDLAGIVGAPRSSETLTLLPWIARRLGRRTADWYPRLAAVPALRTHRLTVWAR